MFGGEDFGMGTTAASLHCLGTTPSSNELLMMSKKGRLISHANSFNILEGIMSRPGDLWQLMGDVQEAEATETL